MQPISPLLILLLFLFVSSTISARNRRKHISSNNNPQKIRQTVTELLDSGHFIDLINYLEDIESQRGVAYHSAQRIEDSEQAFKKCVQHNPSDTRCWINLGESQLHLFKIDDGIQAYEKALNLGNPYAASRLLRAKGWSDSWQNFEYIASIVEKAALACNPTYTNKDGCILEGSSGLPYINAPYWIHKLAATELPSAAPSPYTVDDDIVAPYWEPPVPSHATSKWRKHVSPPQRLKVGLVSSDFGVHPVATLMRGMIQYINTSKIELFCFALNDKLSWWGTNITQTVEHFITLSNMNTQDIATEMALLGIEILIDLNGHTLNSGLNVLKHKPARLQVSFLGFPTSTGADFVDYYMADPVALPVEGREAFVEHIAYMPASCIANDYAQLRGGVLDYNGANRESRESMRAAEDLSKTTVLFATLSNFQKVTPSIFHVWMNILQSVPGSKMLFIEYQGYESAIVHLKEYARAFGVDPDRLALAPQAPWIDHLRTKTSLDMILDTPSKNGHTTGLDGIWAGVPTVSLGGGRHMEQRAAESFAEVLDSYTGIAFSLKEYEDIAIEYARDQQALKIWREHVGRKRVTETLFDTRLWTKTTELLWQAMWEVGRLSRNRGRKPFHVLTLPPKGPAKKITVAQVEYDDGAQSDRQAVRRPQKYLRPILDAFSRGRQHAQRHGVATTVGSQSNINKKRSPRKRDPGETRQGHDILSKDFFIQHDPLLLNIGGYKRKEGWVNVNAQKSSFNSEEQADIVRELHDLHGIPDNSALAIYSSHALEHVPFGDGTMEAALSEWNRVLAPGGLLLVAVPDMRIMARLLLDESLSLNERWFVSKMIYGAQSDEWDYHMTGFDEDTLSSILSQNGFCEIERVGDFNLFDDTSEMRFKNYPISLNIAARKCFGPNDDESEAILLEHEADVYVPFVSSRT